MDIEKRDIRSYRYKAGRQTLRVVESHLTVRVNEWHWHLDTVWTENDLM